MPKVNPLRAAVTKGVLPLVQTLLGWLQGRLKVRL